MSKTLAIGVTGPGFSADPIARSGEPSVGVRLVRCGECAEDRRMGWFAGGGEPRCRVDVLDRPLQNRDFRVILTLAVNWLESPAAAE